MTLFQLKWLRKLVRKNTRPIEFTRALQWRDRLSIAYALLAWNAFGLVCYMVYSGRKDWAQTHGLKSGEEQHLSPCKCGEAIYGCYSPMEYCSLHNNNTGRHILLQHTNGLKR